MINSVSVFFVPRICHGSYPLFLCTKSLLASDNNRDGDNSFALLNFHFSVYKLHGKKGKVKEKLTRQRSHAR